MTRASTHQSRTTTYASFTPNPISPLLSNNLMLSDDDGGPDEAFYARPSIDIPGHDPVIWSGWAELGGLTPRLVLSL